MKRIAFFDFDGTITSQDSYLRFLIYSSNWFYCVVALVVLFPVIVGYAFGVIDNSLAKALTLRWFYTGFSKARLEELGKNFCREIIPAIIRPQALQKIQWHQTEGHVLVLVTASVREWVEPWAREQGFKVIATELEVQDGVLTGRMKTPNNWGPEKLRRIEAEYLFEDYEFSYAYGDSRGDQEMLAAVDEGHYRPFRE
ncbi:MAG: HAD family hydrolase [Candidatus Cloacimonetes bacterium]|nr:HAD family hydrolase [Candidatus Cloacimonadota bacterium]